MKICQICAVQFTAEKFLLDLVDGLQDNGHEVIMVYESNKDSRDLRLDGYCVQNMKISRDFNLLSKFSEIFTLYRYFRNEQFDVVHCHTPIGGLIGRIAAKLAGVKLIYYTVHGFYFHENSNRLEYFFHSNLERILSRITNLMLTVSREDYVTAISRYIIPEQRVVSINNGVDSIRFDPVRVLDRHSLRQGFRIKPDELVIGIVCRLVREKGVVDFLLAATKLKGLIPDSKIIFMIVGETLPSDRDQTLKNEIENYKRILGDSLLLTGYRVDIPDMLSIMDVFCLPSWREGLPVTIIEAMMMNKFVIATNIRGSRELICNSSLGLIVEPKSPDSLLKAFQFCIDNPKKISNEKLFSRQAALEKYEVNSNIKIQVGIIEKYSKGVLN